MPGHFTNRALYSRSSRPVQLERRAVYPQSATAEPLQSHRRSSVLKYAKDDEDVGDFLDSLGTPGKIIKSIADSITKARQRTEGKRSESTAQRLLEAFGFEVSPPRHGAKPSEIEQALAAAQELLRQSGYVVERPSPSEPAIEPLRPETQTNVVEIGGLRLSKDHPAVTGEKVPTSQSSNVWSIQYDLDQRALFIRFQAPKTKQNPAKRSGPLYRYSNVPPDVFLAMLKATSKGGFVWDRIRVRGTVSGHRYDYDLAAVRENHVPRKATLITEGEAFVERQILTRNRRGVRKVLKSKPTVLVNRDTLNRGSPNRGRPNRGR